MLIRLLDNIRYPEYLCVLNEVFNVRFPITKQYTISIESERLKILEQLLMNLTEKCFQKLWIIIIDDIEYADEESLNFFDIFIQTDMFLFIISVGRKVGAEYKLANILLKKARVCTFFKNQLILVRICKNLTVTYTYVIPSFLSFFF